MKVKKKYILIIFITLFLVAVIGFITFYTILSNLNISFEDGRRYIARGFSFEPADKEDIYEHEHSAQKLIDIIHYDLHFDLYPDDKLLKSRVNISGLTKSNKVDEIELNFYHGFNISEVKFNGKDSKFIYDDDKIIIPLNESDPDTFKISISYDGTPEQLGFGSFVFGTHNNKSSVYTLSEPIFASSWFPCNDIPSDKVMTDIWITNDSSMTSVSNGILVGMELNSDRKTYHWQTRYPISTYLISIYSADYEHFQEIYISDLGDTMNIDYFVFEEDLENAKIDFSIHSEALQIFSELFGEYPFIEEKYGVAQFLWNLGAMEHQTITGIGENFVSGNKFFTGLLVHELAHQWWGNAVTLESWKDIWLNEGFATYSEALYWEKINGFSSLKSTMKSYSKNFSATTLYNPEELFSRTVYNKGAWVLHMLRNELGDKTFFDVLKLYYEKYKYSNSSTFDLIDIVESNSGRDFSKFFDQWVFNGKGKIEIEYSYDQSIYQNNHNLTLKLNQVQVEYGNYEFILDLEFYLDDGKKRREQVRIKDRTTDLNFTFSDRITKLDVDPDNWLAAKITYTSPSEN